MDLSIILPAHNESDRIGSCLRSCAQYLSTHPYTAEVIVVENGSTDATVSKTLLSALMFKRVPLRLFRIPMRSKALAVQKGVMEARGAHLYIADVDLSTPLDELPRFLESARDAAIVVGSRLAPGSFVRQSKRRSLMTRCFHGLVRPLVPGIHDTQCGFKLFERDIAQLLFRSMRITSLAYDVEILSKAIRNNYKVAEIPVIWKESSTSRVRLVRDSARMALDVIRLMISVVFLQERRPYTKTT